MNIRAMNALGAIPPLALVKNEEESGHNNNEGENSSSQVDQPTTPRRQTMNQNESAAAQTTETQAQPAQAPRASTIELPHVDTSKDIRWYQTAVAHEDVEARKLEAQVRLGELEQRKAEFASQDKRLEQRMKWEEEDRKFVNRHLIPAVKFVAGTAAFFGIAAAVSALVGEDVTEAAEALTS